ncbi:uncharacterized protein LOC127632102 [Xyrauchen texanus]|uniref:uncharacterized protein LOC127632102 n=1 Tax=Xyrauchen texanus TaxID=154827 RepID=UPI00224270D4|nr:uncharacterized protein LOC127632102 [Xyrauchen texanus]
MRCYKSKDSSSVGYTDSCIIHMAQGETFELAMEQGHMLQVLMRHCQNMKRQETRFRLATAFLFAAFLATLVWLQCHQQTTMPLDALSSPETLNTEEGSSKGHSVHLELFRSQNGYFLKEQLIQWIMINNGLDSANFKLINDSHLNVFRKGLYLISIRISYRILDEQCQPNDDPIILKVQVTQQHSNYLEERAVITGLETMPCLTYWVHSISLNRVIMLEADTTLRVTINPKSGRFVQWTKNSHFEVTYL